MNANGTRTRIRTRLSLAVTCAVLVAFSLFVGTSAAHAQPSLDWGVQDGTVVYELAENIVADDTGNTLTVGWTDGSLGGPHIGSNDVFVHLANPDGTSVWTRQFGTTSLDTGCDVAFTGDGGYIVVGNTYGNLYPSTYGGLDAFIVRFNAAGTPLWSDQFGTGDNESANAVALDSAGNIYVAGETGGNLAGTGEIGYTDGYLRSYTAGGAVRWTRQFGITGLFCATYDIASDATGNTYVVGDASYNISPSEIPADATVWSYNSAGTLRWDERFGSSADDVAKGVAIDNAGDVYVVGDTQGTLYAPYQGVMDQFAVKFPKAGPPLVWAQQFGTSGNEDFTGVAIEGSGPLVVCGEEGSTSRDLAVYTLDPATGAMEFSDVRSSAGNDYCRAIDAGEPGAVYIAGGTMGDLFTSSAGSTDYYFAKYLSGIYLPDGILSVAGSTRYTTAIEASKLAFPNGATSVVIATGENWPDALGGSALAGAVDGPLLLTKHDALPAAVMAELKRLAPSNAYILGGSNAIGAGVDEQLDALGIGTVRRLAGSTRYGTANLVAKEVIAVRGSAYDGQAFVTTGENFPDALGASPLAACFSTPILLTATDGTPYLPSQVDSAVILGGPLAVTAVTEAAVESALGASKVTRVGGVDRYDTAAKIADHGVAHGMRWDGLGIATGADYPDALSGGAMLGSFDSVLLLTKPTSLANVARLRITKNKADINTVSFIGGTAAVSQSVRNEVAKLIE